MQNIKPYTKGICRKLWPLVDFSKINESASSQQRVAILYNKQETGSLCSRTAAIVWWRFLSRRYLSRSSIKVCSCRTSSNLLPPYFVSPLSLVGGAERSSLSQGELIIYNRRSVLGFLACHQIAELTGPLPQGWQ